MTGNVACVFLSRSVMVKNAYCLGCVRVYQETISLIGRITLLTKHQTRLNILVHRIILLEKMSNQFSCFLIFRSSDTSNISEVLAEQLDFQKERKNNQFSHVFSSTKTWHPPESKQNERVILYKYSGNMRLIVVCTSLLEQPLWPMVLREPL